MNKQTYPNTRNRPSITRTLQRQLFIEVGWRCAIPSCNEALSLEIAHIKPHSNGGKSDFSNLIVLCANHHTLYDSGKGKLLDKKAMLRIKNNLQILNGRYCHFELRLLKYFLDSKTENILLFGRELDVYFLLKDGLLAEDPKRFINSINFPPKLYLLTEAGKNFIGKWENGKAL